MTTLVIAVTYVEIRCNTIIHLLFQYLDSYFILK